MGQAARKVRTDISRAEILDAARALIAAEGAAKLTISKVAKAAGLAPRAMFAHFAGKNELMTAILAEDLAGFAARMRTVAAPEVETNPECAEMAQPAPHPNTRGSAPAATPVIQPSASEQTSIEERLARLEARRVDAWLERRLRVFEHTLEALQARQSAVEEAQTRALSLMEQREADLSGRVSETERVQADGLRDARQLFVELANRVEALKAGGAFAEPMEMPAPESSGSDDHVPEAASTPPPAPPSDAPPSSSGIRAAREAARAAAAAIPPEPEKQGIAKRIVGIFRTLTGVPRRTQALAGVALMLFATLSGAGLMLSRGQPLPRGNAGAEFGLGQARIDSVRHKSILAASVPETPMVENLQHAAETGDPNAQYRLGVYEQRTAHTLEDRTNAVRWYERAALQGHRKAMHNLAVAYAQGWGTDRNEEEAARWFAKAAALGYGDSQFNLAVMFERGLGVPQSLFDAYKWYAIAASGGDGEARERLQVLDTQLTPQQLAAARASAMQFSPLPMQALAEDAHKKSGT